MSLTIYGPPQTRVTRTLWMAHELGLDFDSDPGFDENRTPTAELLAANAMGQSPTIDDDGFALAESMAINLYLARKHGKLAPASFEDEAQTWRWSFWVMTAVEPGLQDVLMHKFGVMGYEQDDEAAKAAAEPLERPFNVLEQALDGRDYLLGGEFTVADLNVASVMAWGTMGGLDFAAQPNVAAWLGRCLGRDAARRAHGQ